MLSFVTVYMSFFLALASLYVPKIVIFPLYLRLSFVCFGGISVSIPLGRMLTMDDILYDTALPGSFTDVTDDY